MPLGPARFRAVPNAQSPMPNALLLQQARQTLLIERDAIAATLEATHFKISKSAEILGISRKTLLEKRKKYGLG